MAITKQPLIRYKILDQCFRNTARRYFIEDLINECNKVLEEISPSGKGISRRQVLDDIAFMESAEGWDIELDRLRDGRRVYYRYSDPSFSINNMPLNEMEVNQLQSAIDILSQFKGMPQFDWMQELVPKLKQGTHQQETGTVMDFETNPFLKGTEFLGDLYNAIVYNKVLEILYQDFKSPEPYKLILHPYYLKQYNSRWFVFGFNPEKEKYDWNLAVDRIKSIHEKKGRYKKNTQIDWQEYFDDLVGVTRPEGKSAEKVQLLFFGDTCRYIESKPLHGSQKVKWLDKSTLEVTLELIINYEFERLVISYANAVKVMAPKSLKDSILNRLEKAVLLYTK